MIVSDALSAGRSARRRRRPPSGARRRGRRGDPGSGFVRGQRVGGASAWFRDRHAAGTMVLRWSGASETKLEESAPAQDRPASAPAVPPSERHHESRPRSVPGSRPSQESGGVTLGDGESGSRSLDGGLFTATTSTRGSTCWRGELTFRLGDEVSTGRAGEIVFAPRGAVHTLANRRTSRPLSTICTPAGFERTLARRAAERAGGDPPERARETPDVEILGLPIDLDPRERARPMSRLTNSDLHHDPRSGGEPTPLLGPAP